MIRMTLRQFRTEAIISFGLLVVLAIVLAVTGPHLAQVNDAFQRACKVAGDCATATNPVHEVDVPLQGLLPFVVTVAPALIGLFFGAPLVARELETGTFRLAWTQSVTKRRWLAAKLGVVGLVAMAISGLLTWMVNWWASPLDAANMNRFDPAPFGVHGVAPIGYAAFAFALGATAGLVLRRTVPAMATILVGFVVARLAVEYWVRPNLATPVHQSLAIASTNFGSLNVNALTGIASLVPLQVIIPNDWVLSSAVVDRSGQALTTRSLLHACPAYGQIQHSNALPTPAQMQSIHDACIAKLSAAFHTVVVYQPGGRFWAFQWAEMGIFLAGAVTLCGLAYWWLRRRYA